MFTKMPRQLSTPASEPVIAAGILIMTRSQPAQFLLMRHPKRWDLPKGHSDPGETTRETAIREMQEETGISPQLVSLDPQFEFVTEYPVKYENESTSRTKRVYYYLGWIDQPCEIQCSEHDEARWFDWQPPHNIQPETINPLLEALAQFLSCH